MPTVGALMMQELAHPLNQYTYPLNSHGYQANNYGIFFKRVHGTTVYTWLDDLSEIKLRLFQ